VNAAGTHRRVQALVATGWSQAKLARRLGMTSANFGAMMRRPQVTASTARATAAIYDVLWNQPPPETGQREKIAAGRARNHARARGWAPPLAWDDEQLDRPEAKPAEGWQRANADQRSPRRRTATPGRRRAEMSIEITENQMTCDTTGHTASRRDAEWQVSWLPGRTLTRKQAITAMTLGETAGRGPQHRDRIWPFAEAWAAELALPAPPRRSTWPAAANPSNGTHPVSRDADRDGVATGVQCRCSPDCREPAPAQTNIGATHARPAAPRRRAARTPRAKQADQEREAGS
jgi:hypothetical protein